MKTKITKENCEWYYNKSLETNSFTSAKSAINTKTPYDIALERGDKLREEGKYEDAKLAFEEAKKNNATNEVIIKLEAIDKIIEIENTKTKAYNDAIEKGQSLMNRKKYEEAKASYQVASTLKPNEKEAIRKISEINKKLEEIENERLYDEQMQLANESLKKKEYESEKTYLEKALKYKPNDNIAESKLVTCDAILAVIEVDRIVKEYEVEIKLADKMFANKKYEEAKALYEEAGRINSVGVRHQKGIDACNYYLRLAAAKEEKNIDNKITLLENLRSDYPEQAYVLSNLINEAKSHKQIIIPLTKSGNTHRLKAKINNVLNFDFPAFLPKPLLRAKHGNYRQIH